MKVLALRRAGVCCRCCRTIEPGTRAGWDSATRTVRCLGCLDEGAEATAELPTAPTVSLAPTVPVEVNVPVEPAAPVGPPVAAPPLLAGASAQREYYRRSQRREAAIRAKHPKLGRLILALADEPAHTRVWAQGARGERAVAAKLEELAGEHVAVMHDRALLRVDGRVSRANLDHIAVAATGVWVIDAKTHRGALEVRRSGGLFSPRVEKLYIGGRDKTVLLDGLAK